MPFNIAVMSIVGDSAQAADRFEHTKVCLVSYKMKIAFALLKLSTQQLELLRASTDRKTLNLSTILTEMT